MHFEILSTKMDLIINMLTEKNAEVKPKAEVAKKTKAKKKATS